MESKKPYIVDGQRITHDEYVKTMYEDLRIRVPKGKKEIITSFTISTGESVNSFVNRAIDEAMKKGTPEPDKTKE